MVGIENGGLIDLLKWEGAILTEQQKKALWTDCTAHELLCECPSAYVSV